MHRRILRNLHLSGEKQRTTGRCTGRQEHPQPAEQQALSLIRRQSFELCRSHTALLRTPPGAISARARPRRLPRSSGHRRSATDATKTLADSVGDRREELRRDWVDFFDTNHRSNGEIVHTREYVLVLGTRRNA